MLLEAIIEAVDKELATTKEGGTANPLEARLEAVPNDLGSFEHEKEQIDNKYFQLAAGVQSCKNCVEVTNSKVDAGKVKSADTIKPSCATLRLTPSEFQVWAT